MTYTAVKEKLHSYIETGDQKRIKAIYSFLENEMPQDSFNYDVATIKALEKISEDAFTGKTKTMSVKQSMENIKRHRMKNGI
jgi:hypothetical protein